jgi:hypothetical protein
MLPGGGETNIERLDASYGGRHTLSFGGVQ